MKKVLLSIMCMMILLGGAVSVAAQNEPEINGEATALVKETVTVEPRALICGICGGKTYETYSYSPWLDTGEYRLCTHGFPYGGDYYQRRTKTKRSKCSSCGSVKTISTTTEYRWDCRGINIPDTGE